MRCLSPVQSSLRTAAIPPPEVAVERKDSVVALSEARRVGCDAARGLGGDPRYSAFVDADRRQGADDACRTALWWHVTLLFGSFEAADVAGAPLVRRLRNRFDFVDHQLVIRRVDGRERRWRWSHGRWPTFIRRPWPGSSSSRSSAAFNVVGTAPNNLSRRFRKVAGRSVVTAVLDE